MNERINTVRKLKEEKLLVKSILCYLGLHNYTVWSTPTKELVYSEWSQSRTCCNCNKVEIRSIAYRH